MVFWWNVFKKATKVSKVTKINSGGVIDNLKILRKSISYLMAKNGISFEEAQEIMIEKYPQNEGEILWIREQELSVVTDSSTPNNQVNQTEQQQQSFCEGASFMNQEMSTIGQCLNISNTSLDTIQAILQQPLSWLEIEEVKQGLQKSNNYLKLAQSRLDILLSQNNSETT